MVNNFSFRRFLSGAVILAAIGFVLGGHLLPLFAAPPASPYSPGETLDPSCAPGDANCSVTAGASGSGAANFMTYWSATSTLASTTGMRWDPTNSRLAIGTTTAANVLSLGGAKGTGITLTGTYLGGRRYDLRNAGEFQLVDATASSTRMIVSSSGQVGFGSSTIPSETKFYVYGGSSGANIDVRADDDTESSTVELQRRDYDETFKSVWLQYSGPSVFGTALGLPIADSARLVFQDPANAMIYTVGSAPLLFGTNMAEQMRIAADGKIGMGTTTPATTLQVDGSARMMCLELLNSDGSGTINYITALNGVLSASTVKPASCE